MWNFGAPFIVYDLVQPLDGHGGGGGGLDHPEPKCHVDLKFNFFISGGWRWGGGGLHHPSLIFLQKSISPNIFQWGGGEGYIAQLKSTF